MHDDFFLLNLHTNDVSKGLVSEAFLKTPIASVTFSIAASLCFFVMLE